MEKRQKLLSFNYLLEEDIEETLENILKEYTIIAITTVPLFSGTGTGDFLPPRMRYVYDIYVVVEEDEVLVRKEMY